MKLRKKLAKAWELGHKYPRNEQMGDCMCGAYCECECGCGKYYTGNLLSLKDNPYKKKKEVTE